VQVKGEGPTVLLLHGFPDSSSLWRHQIPLLVAAGYRVIAYDQRGFGVSDAPTDTRAYGWGEIVADAVAVLRAVGTTEPVRVVGHDWGAVIGWLLAIHHPELVNRLVAISVGHPTSYLRAGLRQRCKAWYIAAFQIPGFAEQLIRAANWGIFRAVTRWHSEFSRWHSDLSRPGRLEAALGWYRANASMFRDAVFGNASVDVLGIWSTKDVALVESQMVESASRVEGSWHYERMAGVGHWIPLDAPDQLGRLLIDYFSRDLAAQRSAT
jgi:pimeloyl-ACP methyl ester carboxylesterase